MEKLVEGDTVVVSELETRERRLAGHAYRRLEGGS